MDIGLYHSCIDPQSLALHDLLFLRNRHYALINLFHDLRSQRASQSPQGLGIGHLAGTHPRKFAIYQIGPHLPLQDVVTPVAGVLQYHQAQHHVGRRPWTPEVLAPGRAPGQGQINRLDQFLIVEHFIGVPHPGFPQVCNLLIDESFAEGALPAPRFNHGSASVKLAVRSEFCRGIAANAAATGCG